MGYFALFSEVGLIFLVTTLAGALVGYWADQQLGTLPILVVVGTLGGFAVGSVAVYRLIARFLASFRY